MPRKTWPEAPSPSFFMSEKMAAGSPPVIKAATSISLSSEVFFGSCGGSEGDGEGPCM